MPDTSRPGFTSGSMSTHVMRLSSFMVMGFIAMTIAQLVEAFYLGMVGSAELAAAAFAFPVIMAFNATTRGIGIGTGAVLARAIGAGDRERAARMASHGLLLTLAFTIFCALLLAWQAPAVFALLGAEGHILELSSLYMAIWCIGFPSFGLSMVGAGLMRSIGDPAFPGYVMTVGSVLQMLLGPPLIFGWFGFSPMGIEGAAWAFVLARAGTFCLTAWWFIAKEKMIRLSWAGFGQSSKDILHVGVPAGASNLIGPLTLGATTRILADFGPPVVAGFGVASRIDMVAVMVMVGIAASAGPLVGQNWGARLYDRVNEALRLAYRYCLIWGLIAATIMWTGGEYFVRLITTDEALVTVATRYLYIVPVSIGLMGMLNVATASFNALSKPVPPLVLSLTRLFLFYIPAAIFASQNFGPVGVFVVMVLSNLIFGVAGWQWNSRLIKSLTS